MSGSGLKIGLDTDIVRPVVWLTDQPTCFGKYIEFIDFIL